MPIRILTGIVNIGSNGPKSGSVRIGFVPHARINGDATVVERGEVGPAIRFSGVPAKMVALRQTAVQVVSEPMKFIVNDTITRDSLTIRWRGVGSCFSEEISYLVFGEVPEVIRIPPRLTPVGPRGPRIPPRGRSKKRKR